MQDRGGALASLVGPCLLLTLLEWRPTRAGGPGPSAGVSGGWPESSTTSARDQRTALQAAWGGCAYCGGTEEPLHRDCVLPISRGGRYTLGNVVPACAACHSSKCSDEVTGWLRRKRLDERAFLLRHVELRMALSRTELTAHAICE